jgi:hypothetical protein
MDQPRAVTDGLLAAPLDVGGVTLHPLSLAHYLLLRQIGHPAVRVENPELTPGEWAELAYVLARPSREAVRARAAGEEAWTEAVVVFAAGIPLDSWPRLREEVQRLLREAFAAAPPPSADLKKKSPAA